MKKLTIALAIITLLVAFTFKNATPQVSHRASTTTEAPTTTVAPEGKLSPVPPPLPSPALTQSPTPTQNWKNLPDAIEVCVLPDLPLTFRKVSSSDDGTRKTWIGTNAGYNFVYCATEKLLDGVVTFPSGESFTIHGSDKGVTVTEDTVDIPCGVADLCKSADAITQSDGVASDLPCGTVSTDRIFYYDILFLYTTGSKTTWGSTNDEVTNKYSSYIAASNLALANSNIANLQFRCVGVVEVTTDTFNPDTTLTHPMQDSLDALSGATYGGKVTPLSTFATAQRNSLGADVVQMALSGTKYDAAGLAWVGGEYCTVYEAANWKTVAHELGHTIGCNHDRITQQTPTTDTNYNYGYMVLDPTATTFTRYHGDIMSYAGDRLAYFSNPGVTTTVTQWNNTTATIAIGASNADNARYITEKAPTVTSRKQNTAGPIITSQPASVNANLGTDVTLTVTATGAGLSYQWYKNSVAITGANGSTLALPVTTSTDGASYYVVISNSIDKVTSNTATVTLTTPTAPVTATTTTTGGDGKGGGACGLEYLLALLGIAGLRYLTRRN